ncbi:hypothetical protein EV421DRAFT_1900975 [Armillaria borealis]|uniref:Uncharacterized protein n=1 Tax=Armillaria borealis TaxID=47425 RepID=A0AA39MVD8_9AGAR|nr:hypothetical protein EV421DRAFT_1900975 [Armillaria borealis]
MINLDGKKRSGTWQTSTHENGIRIIAASRYMRVRLDAVASLQQDSVVQIRHLNTSHSIKFLADIFVLERLKGVIQGGGHQFNSTLRRTAILSVTGLLMGVHRIRQAPSLFGPGSRQIKPRIISISSGPSLIFEVKASQHASSIQARVEMSEEHDTRPFYRHCSRTPPPPDLLLSTTSVCRFSDIRQDISPPGEYDDDSGGWMKTSPSFHRRKAAGGATEYERVGWTEPDSFSSSEDEVALKHCTARYHAPHVFITGWFLCPDTLDIDLFWHTHQFMAPQYSRDCLEHVRRFIDHGDKIAENRLSRAFDITCRAWQDRFGIPYTHCGCPLPGNTIGQKLSRLISIHKQSVPPSHLVPPRDRSDLLASTHLSDFNAVYAFKHQRQIDALRRARLEKRERRIRREGMNRNSVDHDPAFLVPVPLYFDCDTGCVTMTGHVVGGGGGAGGCGAVVLVVVVVDVVVVAVVVVISISTMSALDY